MGKATVASLEARLAVLEESAVNAYGGDALRAKLDAAGDEDEEGTGDE